MDYRKQNAVTKLPLPRIDNTVDLLAGAQYFTTQDIGRLPWNPLPKKTAFTTYSGLEFRKMPFGLVNAPATFQKLMEVVLVELARDRCLIYLNDILVVGKTLNEHNQNLSAVLQRIHEAGLRLQPKKCKFVQEAEYLGHLVSANGVRTDSKKVDAVQKFPVSVDLRTLRYFLGLASYYRRFVPGFSRIAGPLRICIDKEGCTFCMECGLSKIIFHY